jgi:uncharacterized protein with beta-barrel porin domain
VSHIVFGFFAAGKSLRRACKSLTLIATALIATCVGSLFATQAWAIDVASQTDWNTAVAAVAAAGAGTTVTINITGGFTLTSSLAQLQASAANVTVNITGNGQTINGASSFQGIQVSGTNDPTVNISNLALTNTKAVGGTGANGQAGYFSSTLSYGSGGGGGGGMGAGGGLFVGSGASVTVSGVTFTNSNATGGTGGNGGSSQNSASSATGGNGGAGGVLNGGAGTIGGGGAGGAGGNTGTQGTGGSVGTALGAGAGGGGGSGTTSSTTYTTNNAGGGTTTQPGAGRAGGDGVTNFNGALGPGADGGTGGNGGAAQGGAIYVASGGSLTILDSPISGSSVTAGTGGSGSTGQGPDAISGSPGLGPLNPGFPAAATAGAGMYLDSVQANVGVSAGTQTYADVIGGTGGLNKIGGGTLVLTATETYTGPTNVNAGRLEVNGSIQGSNVTANANGTLAGTGTVNAATTIASGGMLAPGSTASPFGKLTIGNSLAFQTGSFFGVSFTPSSSSSVLVTGTGGASLGGIVLADFAPGSYVAKQYTILTAPHGISGTFSGLANIGLPSGMTDSLSYSGDSVFLNIALGFGNFSGLNTNQQNVANALTNSFNTNGGIPGQFVGLIPGGLAQIDGEAATGAERGAFQLGNEFLSLMLDPFVSGRGNMGGGGGIGSSAPGFAPEEQTNLPPDVALAYASILNKAPPQNFEQRWTAWGSAFGGTNNSNGAAATGSNNVKTSVFGFAGGMDYHLTPQTVVGFALAGAGTNWGLSNALGSGRSDALQAGAYGISWFGQAYLAGALSFSNHWFTTDRTALGSPLSANFIGQNYGARLESGYRVGVARTVGITPYGAVQFQDFHTPAYSESDPTGAGLGLSYAAMNATDVRTELGSRIDAPTLVYGRPLVLYGRLAWAHDFVSTPALSAAFQALPGGTFTVNGAPIPHDSALTTAGAQLYLTPQWTLIAKFDGEFASNSQTYAGTGTLRYTW